MQRLFIFTLGFLLFSCVTHSPETNPIKASSPKAMDWSTMEAAIKRNDFPKTNGVLINLKGKMIYEGYFGEGHRDRLNDTRSVGKSLTAIVTGQAIAQGKLKGIETPILPFLEKDLKPENNSQLRSDIRVQDLLTMSSALDADDMNDKSVGNEDRMHEQKLWTPWAINLPVSSGYRRDAKGLGPFHYGTVQAFLMGQVLQKASNTPIDQFIAKELLAPLGITEYEFQRSPSSEVMTGGGLRLRGLDLLAIGQMVLEGGSYQGRRIVDKEWIKECLTVRRMDPDSGAGYGYFFWNMDFVGVDYKLNGWFMAGNGGNIVLILKDLDAVIVLSRSNFNSPKGALETIKLITQYIIPQLSFL